MNECNSIRSSNRVLQQEFYSREPKIVARELLGKTLISTSGGKKTGGLIVETEAYLSKGDSACHGYHRQTTKNSSMFGPAGYAYVYPIHAKYCFNTVTEEPGKPSAVLIRALQPIFGIEEMERRRKTNELLNLCSGPSKLCQALGIGRYIDGRNLTSKRKVWIIEDGTNYQATKATARIGVTSAKNLKLRFVVKSSEFASGPKYLR